MKPEELAVEVIARAMFERSFGYQLGLYHWPGDEPRRVRCEHFETDGVEMTIPADHPDAPGGGAGPETLREIARGIVADLKANGLEIS